MKKTLTTKDGCKECGYKDTRITRGYCKRCYNLAHKYVASGGSWDDPQIAARTREPNTRDSRRPIIDEYTTPRENLDTYYLNGTVLNLNRAQMRTVNNAIYKSYRGGVYNDTEYTSAAVYAVLLNNERLAKSGAKISQHFLYENIRNIIYREARANLNVGLWSAPKKPLCFEELPNLYREDCTEKMDFEELMVHCLKKLEGLPMRTIEVFYWRRTTDSTLEDLGKLYGVTRERIRQLEEKAHKKLRRALSPSNPGTPKERLVFVHENTLDHNRSVLKSERAALRAKRNEALIGYQRKSKNNLSADKAAIRKKIEYHTNLKDYFERMEQDL